MHLANPTQYYAQKKSTSVPFLFPTLYLQAYQEVGDAHKDAHSETMSDLEVAEEESAVCYNNGHTKKVS